MAASPQVDLHSIRPENYDFARARVLAMGLLPAPLPRGGQFDQCSDAAICRAYPEVVGCSGTGVNSCRVAFIAPNGRIVVAITSGEEPGHMHLDGITWANAQDSKAVKNIIAGKPEMSE